MRLVRDELGQSLVEIALSLPILAFLLLGGADMARAYAVQMAVQNGARAGAEAAAIDYAPTTAKADSRACDEMGRTPGMDTTDCLSAPLVRTTFAQADGSACPDPVVWTKPCYATVTASYTFRLITPWPLIPHVFAFQRTTSMRMFAPP